MKHTKIICTLGPSTSTLDTIIALIENGMDVARLNFSHGTHDEQKQRIELVREASRQTGKPIAILQDLQGPKIRIGDLIKNVLLNPGDRLRITTEDIIGDYHVVSTSYKEIVNDVLPGDVILVDDGRIELKVLSKTKTEVETQIVIGGILKPHKGLNLPGVKMSVPSLSGKDKLDLEFGLENGVDMVALSFVRSENDIIDLRKRIRARARQPWIIAKIEKPEAIECIDEIIVEADGIMVARGDLGVEMKTAEVPVLQKRIVEKCNRLVDRHLENIQYVFTRIPDLENLSLESPTVTIRTRNIDVREKLHLHLLMSLSPAGFTSSTRRIERKIARLKILCHGIGRRRQKLSNGVDRLGVSQKIGPRRPADGSLIHQN
ncbi:MAG: pyruvate kinase, partial [Chlorobiales bacterium]|nr:pyruvate kinase [Chlorobiales bacterium]